MSIATNLHGRLRNTSLPYSSGMLPLYEAVANAIHAIEDRELRGEKGEITVQIVRDSQIPIGLDDQRGATEDDPKGDIVGFIVVDNGVGFDDANFRSFLTLDSEYKASRGGRGVGRLLWLKAFDRAKVESVYIDEAGKKKKRTFFFDVREGVSEPIIEDAKDDQQKTKIHLERFSRRFRQASPKTGQAIARFLFEHCLWYFIREGGAPRIRVVDEGETVLLDNIYEDQMLSAASTESIELKGIKFELIHVKLSATSTRTHSIALCAANRLVTQESIRGKIPGLHGNLTDGDRYFVYECYVNSPYLDERVRSERTSFDLEEESLDLLESVELTKKEIRDAVLDRSAQYLSEYLEERRRQGRERVSNFVSTRAPRYRPILHHIPEEALIVDPDISDKELDVLLHKHFADIEVRLLEDGHKVMDPKDGETFDDYNDRLRDYLRKAADIKKSDLANYVAHRRVILDLLEKAIQRKSDGKYVREDLIHNLIMPMGNTSDDMRFDECNLWLIDERLAFHDFLASDKTLSSMPITDSKENKEPDLLAFNVFDTPVLVSDAQKLPLASIVIVELKRPMRNDAAAGENKDPIEQALGYLERIRAGNAQTKSGRPIPKSENIPGFCYAICDITPTIENRCKILGLTPTYDYSGYFGYNQNFRAYLEVISFDRLVNSAKERNKAFFDKLGLPTR